MNVYCIRLTSDITNVFDISKGDCDSLSFIRMSEGLNLNVLPFIEITDLLKRVELRFDFLMNLTDDRESKNY